ncbi:MAG: 30S ribosomal protein S3 [Clostridia bacterium]|nr:30S ribosomal protein S3 [Clostridia bacterium]
MGQKVNPHGIRVGVIKNWDSRWFVKDEVFGDTLVSDYNIRKFLKQRLYKAGVPKIEIERFTTTDANGKDSQRVKIYIHCAKPGMVIGQNGKAIDELKAELETMLKMPVALNIVEVRNPELNAQLVAENIASQLENRISFRRAMKMAIKNTMNPEGGRFRRNESRNAPKAKGIKISCGGRLNGAEIARNEHYHEGTIPLQTLRADIDYGFAEANTTYGKIGVKVWIYLGEVLTEVNRPTLQQPAPRNERPERGDRRNDRRNNGDRRPAGQRREGSRGPRTPREGGHK